MSDAWRYIVRFHVYADGPPRLSVPAFTLPHARQMAHATARTQPGTYAKAIIEPLPMRRVVNLGRAAEAAC